MERIQLTPDTFKVAVQHAAEVLSAGGVVLYPTDTLYGLGVDAFSDDAVAKIYTIKTRDENKPIHAIVADLAMAQMYGEINDIARMLAEKFGGKVTLIVKKRDINTGIATDIQTFGFRIPDNEFCVAVARALGRAITATSANKSGEKPERNVAAILEQLNNGPYSSVLQKTAIGIDLIIDGGELPESKPSTVVDLTSTTPRVLREGVVPTSDVAAIFSLA